MSPSVRGAAPLLARGCQAALSVDVHCLDFLCVESVVALTLLQSVVDHNHSADKVDQLTLKEIT